MTRFFLKILFVFLAIPPISGAATYMPPALLAEAVTRSRSDGVGVGYCGRGLWSVLTHLGYTGLNSANGQDWEGVLSAAGWRPLVCSTPERAPLGSVLVFLSDIRLKGKNLVGTKGGIFGHAELVSTERGRRVYVSDAARPNPGGTVPLNFTRRAWVPPGSAPPSLGEGLPTVNPPSYYRPELVQSASSALLADRLALAAVYFSR